ncbi:MAG: arylsulfatase A-like enzyme [Myxococcota bacterium]|jgi:arylsulfatase A-like enzyme
MAACPFRTTNHQGKNCFRPTGYGSKSSGDEVDNLRFGKATTGLGAKDEERIARNVMICFNEGDTAMCISDCSKGNDDRLGCAGASKPVQLHHNVQQVDCSGVVTGVVEHSDFLDGRINIDIRQSLDEVPQDDETRSHKQAGPNHTWVGIQRNMRTASSYLRYPAAVACSWVVAVLSIANFLGCDEVNSQASGGEARAPIVDAGRIAEASSHTGSGGVARPPNILFIIADDIGVDQIGVYDEGNNPANTPNIDALAKQGMLFRNTWSNPVCSSTRATILTGRYSFRTGVGFIARPGAELRDREYTLPEMLKQSTRASYGSAAFGKWHLSAGRNLEDNPQVLVSPYRAGFNYFRGIFANIGRSYSNWRDIIVVDQGDGTALLEGGTFTTTYNTTAIVDNAAAWIRDFEHERPADPWFAWVAFNAAHMPMHKPPSHLHTVDLSDPETTCDNPPPFKAPERLVPCYRAMIEAMDTEIGRLLKQELSATSRARTTVIFVGDNGSLKAAAGPGGDPNHGKGTTYEGGVNVPLIFAGARVASSLGGTPLESQALVNTTDLFATVLELGGVDVAAVVPREYRKRPGSTERVGGPDARLHTDVVLDSVSLVDELQAPSLTAADGKRGFAYTELFKSGPPSALFPQSRAIRDAQGFKLIRLEDIGDIGPRFELYDLTQDPHERTNLAAQLVNEEVQAVHKTLTAQLDAIVATGWRPHGQAPTPAPVEATPRP